MGFFKKLFKKKKGGTFFGNLLRKGANVASGGILGNGVQLAKNDAKFEAQEMQAVLRAREAQNAAANRIGTQLGTIAKPHFQAALNSQPVEDAKKAFTKAWFKKNWWKLLVPIALVTGIVIWVVKRGKKGGKR